MTERLAAYLEGERLATNARVSRTRRHAAVVTEKAFMQTVLDLAKLTGWAAYHTHNSQRSTAGFPDLILIRQNRLIAAELKRDGKLPTPAQTSWLLLFAQVPGVEATVWTPAQWQTVTESLK